MWEQFRLLALHDCLLNDMNKFLFLMRTERYHDVFGELISCTFNIVVLVRIWKVNNNLKFFYEDSFYTLPSFLTWKFHSHMVMVASILMTFKAICPMEHLYFTVGPWLNTSTSSQKLSLVGYKILLAWLYVIKYTSCGSIEILSKPSEGFTLFRWYMRLLLL